MAFSEANPGEEWEVFVFPRPEAPLQYVRSKPTERETLENLSITGLREMGDKTGDRMYQEICGAIAAMIKKLNSKKYKGLGLIPDMISINEGSKLERILIERHNIVDIEGRVRGSVESERRRS